jgi:hypothetical protein
MRKRDAVLVVGLAASLGTLVGAVVLPDREFPGAPSSTSTTPFDGSPSGSASPSPSVSPTPSPSTSPSGRPSASPTPSALGEGPVDDANMLTVADFRAVGLSVRPTRSDSRLEVTTCTGATHQAYEWETLAEIASSGPPVQREWEAGSVVAAEEAIALKQEEQAADLVRRIVRKFESCQVRPPTYWVYGPTHTERLGASTTVTWLGSVDGELNRTGRAPKDAQVDGGVAVMRRGLHVAVFNLSVCASPGESHVCMITAGGPNQQLAALSRRAALRLG